jgi:hypothetical protein
MAKPMKVVYAVPWIEVDFGERDEGYKLFLDKDRCVAETKKDSREGAGGGCYIGPVRPLYYVEVPFNSLEDSLKRGLKKHGSAHTSDHWQPAFTGKKEYIS